jgi:class 3 adenylate cyclase
MNTASRMESTCTPGLIQVSESTWHLLKHMDQWRSAGGIEIKGKGLMNTYYWDPELTNENGLFSRHVVNEWVKDM